MSTLRDLARGLITAATRTKPQPTQLALPTLDQLADAREAAESRLSLLRRNTR